MFFFGELQYDVDMRAFVTVFVLMVPLRIPSTGSIPSFSDSHHGPVCDLSYGAFHSRLKTHLFFKSFPP